MFQGILINFVEDCETCIHHSGRIVADGKLIWFPYCTFPVYALDAPAEPITPDYKCPLDQNEEFCNGSEN